jgi:excisionase family DNA binding protein
MEEDDLEIPKAANDNEPLLEIKEVAERLGVCERTVQRFIRSGELPYIAMGNGRVRLRKKIYPRDLENFIESRRRFDTCLSISRARAPSITTTSKSVAFGSPALQSALLSETLRLSKRDVGMKRASR